MKESAPVEKKQFSGLPFLRLVFFVILFLVGLNAGEVTSVWEKAVRVCLSCIGIG